MTGRHSPFTKLKDAFRNVVKKVVTKAKKVVKAAKAVVKNTTKTIAKKATAISKKVSKKRTRLKKACKAKLTSAKRIVKDAEARTNSETIAGRMANENLLKNGTRGEIGASTKLSKGINVVGKIVSVGLVYRDARNRYNQDVGAGLSKRQAAKYAAGNAAIGIAGNVLSDVVAGAVVAGAVSMIGIAAAPVAVI